MTERSQEPSKGAPKSDAGRTSRVAAMLTAGLVPGGYRPQPQKASAVPVLTTAQRIDREFTALGGRILSDAFGVKEQNALDFMNFVYVTLELLPLVIVPRLLGLESAEQCEKQLSACTARLKRTAPAARNIMTRAQKKTVPGPEEFRVMLLRRVPEASGTPDHLRRTVDLWEYPAGQLRSGAALVSPREYEKLAQSFLALSRLITPQNVVLIRFAVGSIVGSTLQGMSVNTIEGAELERANRAFGVSPDLYTFFALLRSDARALTLAREAIEIVTVLVSRGGLRAIPDITSEGARYHGGAASVFLEAIDLVDTLGRRGLGKDTIENLLSECSHGTMLRLLRGLGANSALCRLFREFQGRGLTSAVQTFLDPAFEFAFDGAVDRLATVVRIDGKKLAVVELLRHLPQFVGAGLLDVAITAVDALPLPAPVIRAAGQALPEVEGARRVLEERPIIGRDTPDEPEPATLTRAPPTEYRSEKEPLVNRLLAAAPDRHECIRDLWSHESRGVRRAVREVARAEGLSVSACTGILDVIARCTPSTLRSAELGDGTVVAKLVALFQSGKQSRQERLVAGLAAGPDPILTLLDPPAPAAADETDDRAVLLSFPSLLYVPNREYKRVVIVGGKLSGEAREKISDTAVIPVFFPEVRQQKMVECLVATDLCLILPGFHTPHSVTDGARDEARGVGAAWRTFEHDAPDRIIEFIAAVK